MKNHHTSSWSALVTILALLPCLVEAQPAPGRPITLHGKVLTANSRQPIAGARVGVVCCTDSTTPKDTILALTHTDGSFTLGPVRLGKSVLSIRAIGFMPHQETLSVDSLSEVLPDIALEPAVAKLGYAPPDDSVVARVRRAKKTWKCSTDETALGIQRREWMRALAPASVLRSLRRLSKLAGQPNAFVVIREDAMCRRAAEVLDQGGVAASLEYYLFRVGEFYLISQPDHFLPTILDRRFRRITAFVVE
jgi:hypothetical protein